MKHEYNVRAHCRNDVCGYAYCGHLSWNPAEDGHILECPRCEGKTLEICAATNVRSGAMSLGYASLNNVIVGSLMYPHSQNYVKCTEKSCDYENLIDGRHMSRRAECPKCGNASVWYGELTPVEYLAQKYK